MKNRITLLCAGIVLVLLVVYGNHFQNEFHFDDYHTIVNNVFLGELRYIPRYFADANLFSTAQAAATYRPVTMTTLAIDYWMGKGFKPFFFHLSTFFWYTVQVILMFFLFRRIMDRADPHPSNLWTALVAAMCFGLHPACAETVNYIIQRGDLYNALGAAAGLLLFVAYPAQRKYGWYVLPPLIAVLAKAPALVFPLLVLAYVMLFEPEQGGKKWTTAFRATLAAWIAIGAAAILTMVMTPAAYHGGAFSASMYRLTQPWVALHYFKEFFLPTELTADTDWTYVTTALSIEAMAGYLFVVGMLYVVYRTSLRMERRPIAFGIIWFFVTLAPTALMPLAEVTNDHRMFFPFVGLALAVVWELRLLLFKRTARLTVHPVLVKAALGLVAVVFVAEAVGTHVRNDVWRTEESLWRDVTVKSPNNGRGWLNYGSAFASNKEYARALPLLQHAETMLPYDAVLQTNLAVSYAGLGRDDEAEQHFLRSIDVAPGTSDPEMYYGRWLESRHRLAEAQQHAENAVRLNPISFLARYLLLQVYSDQRNRKAFDALMEDTIRLAVNDAAAQQYLQERLKAEQQHAAAGEGTNAPPPDTPEALLNLSAKYCHDGDFKVCAALAQKALEKRPGYAEAYNNMAAAFNELGRWDDAIHAASEALRLKPDYPVARKNLEWAQEHKRAAGGK
jgi:tetratricopeptide (TPR) repeat protein